MEEIIITYANKASRTERSPRQTQRPEGKLRHARSGWKTPPQIEDEEIVERWEIFVRSKEPRGYVVERLGKTSHRLALQMGFWSFGEPFEAVDIEDAKRYARMMVAELEESEEDLPLMA